MHSASARSIALMLLVFGAVTGALLGTRASARVAATPAQSAELALVGQLGGPVQGVAVAGSYTYAGVGPRLIVYATCVAAYPIEVGRSEVLPGIVQDVLLAGPVAYVALADAGLGVVDLADPVSPRLTGVVPAGGTAGLLTMADGRLYVGAGYGGVQILDLGDPWSPREIGRIDKIVSDMVVVGRYAYLVERNLTVVDIATPASPRDLTKLEDWADAVATDGRTLYVGASTASERGQRHGELHVYDIGANGRRPPRIGSLALGGAAGGMLLENQQHDRAAVLHIIDGTRLRTIDVDDPAHPWEPSYYGVDIPPTVLAMVALAPRRLVIAAGVAGLRIIDLEPDGESGPREVAVVDGLASAGAVASADGFAYVEDEGSVPRVRIVDIHEPDHPRLVASLPTDVAHKSLAVAGGYAYFGGGDNTLRTFDVRDPSHPRATTSVPMPKTSWAMTIADARLYVVDDNRLRVFDLTDPAAPREAGSAPTSGGATDVAAAGGFAFVTGPSTGTQSGHPSLQVIDVRDPRSPREIGVTAAAGWQNGIALDDPFVFVNGLQVIDVTDLGNPHEVARLASDAESRASVVDGDRLHVAQKGRGGGGRVVAFDVGDARQPREVAQMATIDAAVGIDAWWGYLQVAAGDAGLWVVRTAGARPLPTPEPWIGPPLPVRLYVPLLARGPITPPCR